MERKVENVKSRFRRHVKELIDFYRGAGLPLHVESDYSPEETRLRISDVGKEGKTIVVFEKRGDLRVLFIRGGRPTNIIEFEGQISNWKGKSFVSGRLKLNSGICAFIFIVCFIAVVFLPACFLINAVQLSAPLTEVLVGIGQTLLCGVVLFAVLECGLFIGKTYEINLVKRFLEHLRK